MNEAEMREAEERGLVGVDEAEMREMREDAEREMRKRLREAEERGFGLPPSPQPSSSSRGDNRPA